MRQEKERAQAAAAAARSRLQQAHSNSSQHQYTAASSAHKRKREEEREAATPTKSKKKKMISTTSTKESKKDTKLYCICKTPYDETKYGRRMSAALPLLCVSAHSHTYTLLFLCQGSTLAVTYAPTGIMENVWASRKRRPRRWTTTSVWSAKRVRRAARRSSTASARPPMTSPSKCSQGARLLFTNCASDPATRVLVGFFKELLLLTRKLLQLCAGRFSFC